MEHRERQKYSYDKRTKEHQFKPGDRLMIHMPGTVSGKAWKLARPYHGPYRVISGTPTNVEAQLIDDIDAEPIFVAVNRIRPCPADLSDTAWKGTKKTCHRKKTIATPAVAHRTTGPVTRSMTKNT